MRKLLTVFVLLLLTFAIVGVVSIMGELRASASAADRTETVSYRGSTGLPHAPGVVEAELLGDGRRILLLPAAKDIVVVEGEQVEELASTCEYKNAQFQVTTPRGGLQRVWLFAVVAEEKPNVQLAQPQQDEPAGGPPSDEDTQRIAAGPNPQTPSASLVSTQCLTF